MFFVKTCLIIIKGILRLYFLISDIKKVCVYVSVVVVVDELGSFKPWFRCRSGNESGTP